MKRLILFMFIPVMILLTGYVNAAENAQPPVRNVILMIGDGMGVNQMYAAYTANHGSLYMIERAQYVGLVKTHSADRYNADSAAAGTAIACGEKTNNGMLGVLPDGTPLKSMLDYAAENGLSTGIVATCELTHATPAAFVAKVNSRGSSEDIALAFANAPINISIGGGRKFFEDREDGQNLTEQMRAKGFRVVYTMDEVNATQEGNLLALLAEVALERYPARGNMLPEATAAAINILNQNPKGFFLMVEGSQIDWAAHENNQEEVVLETLDFDRAVKVALDFAERDGNTLVIITGDHETGGMSINNGNFQNGSLTTVFTSTGHTGVPLPVYTFGRGAEKFTGVFWNTEFLPRVLELWGISR